MAPKGKFVLNRGTVRWAMNNDPHIAGAVDNVAEKVANDAGPNATVEHYRTDRKVSGVVVPAIDQARDGAATRAAQGVAAGARRRPRTGDGVRPFKTRAEWRRAFATGAANASARAAVSRGYAVLPERRRKGRNNV
ncbi:head-to-tail connector [Mycobacterium phage Evanesce]|uniref:Head-to-tail connector protein n=14 Tax=Caudoviricetes TaxID=2731619 RepID=A0A8T8JDF8_9CAUD|nr:hypothetical protein Giles_13 [Mycobacterium phage Giles]AHY84198.1 hypothetical protein PBI_HH92_13 [Mycobacterium phage HH92]AKQ07789.1 head-to-tail connector [Mycobacterium phage Kinbote]ALA06657.1 hypothetical protein SEA_OBUpride_13 [Mycobacterium phage OBUpride]ALF00234.1 head-to-tail connector [Mycobacterium phage Evanesce]ATN90371.1 hypothetical protein SEA_LILHAZELNUT_13 [Mycobacterium phage LilHazelnut]QBQ71282.1 hypothetical protein SEA_DAEGAL_14 [Mycobacterium phage Daegal]QDH